jgi:stage III sporulation protein AF
VRNLVVILLLATFLEMLLPNKSMRGFVQMVMGLFVISAVLAPITTFLHTPLEMEIPAWTATTPQDLPAIATEGQGLTLARNAFQEQYRQILVHQIKALALGFEGVEGAEVVVEFEEGAGGLTEQPKIALIEVTLTSTRGEISPVQPVIIGQSPPPTQNQSPRAERVRERIAELMSISQEKIIVQEG